MTSLCVSSFLKKQKIREEGEESNAALLPENDTTI